MFQPQSITLTTRGQPLRIHLFSTGRIADKTRMRKPRFRGPAAMADILLDHRFTEWLPVWVTVIEHPKGIFLIDTGQNADVNNPDYFRPAGPLARWFDTTQFRFDMSPDQQIDQQLARLNIPTPTAIILTHLHFDHIGGLSLFPHIPVLINRLEWEHPHGALPALYPPGFEPTLLTTDRPLPPFKHTRSPTTDRPLPPFQHTRSPTTDRPLPPFQHTRSPTADCPLPPFQHTCSLTGDDDLLLVHTPGHTYGHSSVLLRTDSCHLLIAGDICYDQEQLMQQQLPANLAGRRLARQTYANVKAYAHLNPLILLPSHDGEAAQRLLTLQPLQT